MEIYRFRSFAAATVASFFRVASQRRGSQASVFKICPREFAGGVASFGKHLLARVGFDLQFRCCSCK